MRVLTITNQKGGVGKTTTAQAICAGLVSRGFKVLAVDLDSQGNLSLASGTNNYEVPTVYNVLKREIEIAEAVQNVEGGYDVLPSNIMLASAEQEIQQAGKEFRLREALETVADQYDYVIVDTPPSLGVLTVNALTASNDIIIPLTAGIFATTGIIQLYLLIESVKKYYNPKLRIVGLLFTCFDKRTKIAQAIEKKAEEISEQIDAPIFKTKIRSSVSVNESQARRQDIFDYAKNSTVAKDYEDFLAELLKITEV